MDGHTVGSLQLIHQFVGTCPLLFGIPPQCQFEFLAVHIFLVALASDPPANNVTRAGFLQLLRQSWADYEFHDAALD